MLSRDGAWEVEERLLAARDERLRLSREERDYVAGRALDSIALLGGELSLLATDREVVAQRASDAARKIAALSNLLGDIGWERNHALSRVQTTEGKEGWGDRWVLGELFPVFQLRPWLEEWVEADTEALGAALSDADAERAQTKLDTGAILLARIEKWMASHGN
jgi:hypothetical protein